MELTIENLRTLSRSGRGQFQRVNFNRASVLPVSVYHKMSCVSIDRTYKVKP